MWKLYALFVHVLMVGYVSMIYFRSTILHGIPAQGTLRQMDMKPPADRLVVFITDGFRAESFFRNNVSGLPSIQKILLDQGLAGIARTCAPTQSRPGHIAIFGGFHEDPSAALTNFQRNPSIFDTVFNRTSGTWGWGGRPVIKIFNDLVKQNDCKHFEMYELAEMLGIYGADNWVFNKVRHFLSSHDNVELIKQKQSSMFLIYLGDLDLAGHSAKPNTEKYMKILNNTQAGIGEMYNLFERTFRDKRTVYLMTSDHGMTDSGSHGAGSQHEIEVPFVIWGAGVNRVAPNHGRTFLVGDSGRFLPLHELEQVQLASLMSALIGLPPPINNMAKLPLGYMNVSVKYEVEAVHLNALQLLAQVERMLELHRGDSITDWLPNYHRLDRMHIETYKHRFERMMALGDLGGAMQSSQDIIRLSQESLQYYRNYYRIPLYIACILAYLGWFCHLLVSQARPANQPKTEWLSTPNVVLMVMEVMLLLLFYLHRVPFWTSFYLLMPLVIWIVALRERGQESKLMLSPFIQLLCIVGSAVVLIFTSRYREIISLAYVLVACTNNWRGFTKPSIKFALWVVLVSVLALFSLFRPDLGYRSNALLYLSMLLTAVRPLILNENYEWRIWLSNCTALFVGAYSVHTIVCGKATCHWLPYAFWGYLVFALIYIPYSKTKTPRSRVQLILFNLSTIYTLLSLSYESIFIQLLCMELILGMELKGETKKSEKEETEIEEMDKPVTEVTPVKRIISNYRYALLILFYSFFATIGAGNLPHINSFDPDTGRLFVRELSPLLIGLLIVLKLFIPNVIIMSSLYAYRASARQHVRGIFICLFLICDAICLYVFFFVRNSGSWIGVRASLSNLIIAHGLPILMILFSWVPKHYLSAINLTPLPMLRWKQDFQLSQPGQSQA